MTERQLIDETRTEYSCFNVVQLATARAAELAEFESSVDVLTVRAASKLQRLPVRLRRRAASHRINRLPRRLHRSQNFEASTGKGQPNSGANAKVRDIVRHTKLKSRRYRRRHLRLLAFAARLAPVQLNNSGSPVKPVKAAWLPTHLWHAKRFHMVNRWGWRLPKSPNNKVFKACQNAALNGCLVLDMSYLTCLAVEGTDSQISSLINHAVWEDFPRVYSAFEPGTSGEPLMPVESSGLFLADLGSRDCSDPFPWACPILGPVRILWGPVDWPRSGRRIVYFWFHPTIGSEAYQSLNRYMEQQFAPSTVTDPSAERMHLIDLTGQLCRLRLLGRQSHRLLGDILFPAAGSTPQGDWSVWTYLQGEFQQASEVPPGTVLSLRNCADFRSSRPSLKVRNRNWITTTTSVSSVNPVAASDKLTRLRSLFNDSGSKGVSKTWAVMPPGHTDSTTFKVQEGTTESDETGLDILLIQNGSVTIQKDYPQSVGWDIVLSRSRFPVNEQTLLRGTLAARDLLIACVYRGAEVGGLRELHRWATIGTRGRGCYDAFPVSLWPDTSAGQLCDKETGNDRLAHHNRLPPKLRPDYTRLGTKHPFFIPWNDIIAQHAHLQPDNVRPPIFVLRSCVIRPHIQQMLEGCYPSGLTIEQHMHCFHSYLGALIMVHIHAVGRGVPEPCAVLYTPRDQVDLQDQEYSADDSAAETKTDESANSKRLLLGYVQEGGYDYSTGRGSGLGFISLAALIQAVHRPSCQCLHKGLTRVLMKNPKSTSLRVVQLSLTPYATP